MDESVRSIMSARAELDRERRRIDGLDWPEAKPLVEALETAGIDAVDFGRFGTASFSTFDRQRAAPILIDWLPRVDDARVKEAMVRSLTGQRAARGEGASRLIVEFHRPAYAADDGLRWAIGNAIATLAGPADADPIIEILRDKSTGMPRQMFCDALVRTKDPRCVAVLIDLIQDDDVAGHAISALRRIGRGAFPEPERTGPMLEALLKRPSATQFGERQARAALKSIDHGGP